MAREMGPLRGRWKPLLLLYLTGVCNAGVTIVDGRDPRAEKAPTSTLHEPDVIRGVISDPKSIVKCPGPFFKESSTIQDVQGDTSGCGDPPVDFKTKVPFRPGLSWPGQAKAEIMF